MWHGRKVCWYHAESVFLITFFNNKHALNLKRDVFAGHLAASHCSRKIFPCKKNHSQVMFEMSSGAFGGWAAFGTFLDFSPLF